jgi:hypothetical protein
MEQVNTTPVSFAALSIFGYLFAILSFFFLPIIFMPLGILFGILNICFKNSIHGITIIILALLLGLLGAHTGGWGFGLPILNPEN